MEGYFPPMLARGLEPCGAQARARQKPRRERSLLRLDRCGRREWPPRSRPGARPGCEDTCRPPPTRVVRNHKERGGSEQCGCGDAHKRRSGFQQDLSERHCRTYQPRWGDKPPAEGIVIGVDREEVVCRHEHRQRSQHLAPRAPRAKVEQHAAHRSKVQPPGMGVTRVRTATNRSR